MADPTLVLSYRSDRNELICKKALLEIEGTPGTFTVAKTAVSIGKSDSNDIPLADKYVSNFHCKIENRRGAFFIKDLQSTNGTSVNGRRVVEAELPFDSTIEIGKVKIRFFSAEAAETPEPSAETEFEGIRSRHPKMREIFSLIKRVAPTEATVLIQGETGSGKELIAAAIHNRSGRDKRIFVAMNCAAVSRDLMESELFGHEKGAFTSAHQQRKGVFELANCGTLFLDEIGEMPPDLQSKLLRVLETGEIRRVGGTLPIRTDVRIVAASHKDLAAEVRNGNFREDLFFRLYVVPLKVPPLRERPQDIPLLVEQFLITAASGKKISREAVDRLTDHPWPGNVRELRNTIHRAALDCATDTIGPDDLRFAPIGVREETAGGVTATTFTKTLKDAEKARILTELERNNWNKKATARVLGIAKSTLHERLKRYGVTSSD